MGLLVRKELWRLRSLGLLTDGSYDGNGFSIEIYKFTAPDKIHMMLQYRNGNFGMVIHRPTEGELNKKLINVFNKF
jgi:hypothetical protein